MRPALLSLLLSAAILAGCATPDPEPSPRRSGEGPVMLACGDSSEAFVRLERHSNHGGGDSEYWILNSTGDLLVVRARPTEPLNQTVLTFAGEWTSGERDRLCGAMAGFVKHWEYGEGMLHQSVQINPGSVSEQQVDMAAVGEAVQGFWMLDEDSSGGCLSGGDTWMQMRDGQRIHAVEAACAPDEDFATVLEALYDAVGRRPFK